MTVQETEARTCFHHKDRETGRVCTRCDRPACADCLTQAVVGSHCWECIKAARPARKERVRRWQTGLGPVVTYALIALNLAVFLLVAREGVGDGTNTVLQERLAVLGPAIADGEWYRVVTYGFVGTDMTQLVLGLLALYFLGREVERDLGHVRFLALYLATLVCGAFTAVLLEPNAFMWAAGGGAFGLIVPMVMGLRRRGRSLADGGVPLMLVLSLGLSVLLPGATMAPVLGALLGGGVLGAFMVVVGRGRWAYVAGLAAVLVVSAGVIVATMSAVS